MRSTMQRSQHPNPTPVPPLVEVRPDEYVFASEYHFDVVVPGEERVRALSEHFGAGALS
jgi:hypothetical protein